MLMWIAHVTSGSAQDPLDDCGKVGCCEEHTEVVSTKPEFMATCLELARMLLEFGLPVDGENEFDGTTPLVFALEGNNGDLVRLLLQFGADPDREDGDGDRTRDHKRFAELSGGGAVE